MNDSSTLQPSWIPLIKSSLFQQVMKKGMCASPDTKCSVIYGPKPAVFRDGRILPSTHYHVDACLWKGNTFIDGTTFLMPSKLPEAGSECYSVDLDDTTGVHHVTLRKPFLPKAQPLTTFTSKTSNYVARFSYGEVTALPQITRAANNSKRKSCNTPSRQYQWDSSVVRLRPIHDIVRRIKFGMLEQEHEVDEVEPVRDQITDNPPSFAVCSVPKSYEVNSHGTISAPAEVDRSITECGSVISQQVNDGQSSVSTFSKSMIHLVPRNDTMSAPTGSDSAILRSGRVVGQQAARDQSDLSNFPESIIHIVPQNVTAYTSIDAGCSDAATEAREPVESALDTQTSDNSSESRRPSTGNWDSEASTSTVPTSPASSIFSTLPFEKSTLIDLPKVPIVPGKPSYTIEALALESPKHDDSEKTDDPDTTVLRRLSWDLSLSYRQLTEWDEIQGRESPCLGELPATSGLARTDDGQLIVAEDAGNDLQSSLTLPQPIPEPREAFSSLNVSGTNSTHHGEILGVLPLELMDQHVAPSHHLDLAQDSKETQLATQHMVGKEHTPEALEETDHDAAATQSSEDLDIALNVGETRDSVIASDSPNLDKLFQELFSDDKDEFSPITPIVKIPRPPSAVNIPPLAPASIVTQSLRDTTASVPCGLGSPIPVDAINAINTEFFRLWNEGVSGRCWIPGEDEDEVQNLAAANVAQLHDGLPDDIAVVARDFNRIVAELWEEDHPRRHLVRGSDDDRLIDELAASNLQWVYFSSSVKGHEGRSTADGLAIRARKTLEAAPSSFEWFLQNLGGDDRCREHRSVKVAKVDEVDRSKHDSCGQTQFHHLNFNNDPVYERNYTPAEVSFWAASTTIDKILVPCAEHCMVHRAKVVTSQAFKKVDPVMYTGTDIQALRSLNGSAMRNAATSDVEVAYEAVGTWKQDCFSQEDVKPRVVSADDGDYYEHSESGPYNYLHRPYHINDEHDEHKLCNVNDTQSSNPSMSRVRLGYEQQFSNLGPSRGVKYPYERGHMRYSGKWSSWDPPAQQNTTTTEATVDEACDSNLSAGVELGDTVSEAVGPESDLDDTKIGVDAEFVGEGADDDEETASEAQTDIEGDFASDREPVHYQGRHLIAEVPAAAESSEGAPEEATSDGSDNPGSNSQNESVSIEEGDPEQKPATLHNTRSSLVASEPRTTEEPVEQLAQELKAEVSELSEYLVDTALDVGKDVMVAFEGLLWRSFSIATTITKMAITAL